MASSASVKSEQETYLAEVEAVKQWWKSPRWRYTKRPFTAEAIVQKRGNLKIEYPSNVQAKKLWGIMEKRFPVRLLLRIFWVNKVFDNLPRKELLHKHTDV